MRAPEAQVEPSSGRGPSTLGGDVVARERATEGALLRASASPCAYCRLPAPSSERRDCGACHAPHHAACLLEAGGCARAECGAPAHLPGRTFYAAVRAEQPAPLRLAVTIEDPWDARRVRRAAVTLAGLVLGALFYALSWSADDSGFAAAAAASVVVAFLSAVDGLRRPARRRHLVLERGTARLEGEEWSLDAVALAGAGASLEVVAVVKRGRRFRVVGLAPARDEDAGAARAQELAARLGAPARRAPRDVSRWRTAASPLPHGPA